MSKKPPISPDKVQNVINQAEEISKEEINKIMEKYDKESAVRHSDGFLFKIFVPAVLILFSLVQLYSTWKIIPSTHMRPFHVGIVVFVAYLLYPIKKGGFKTPRGQRISLIVDIILACTALFCYLYYVVKFNEIAMQTRYTTFQYWVGGVAIFLLMEACRRAVGLPIVLVSAAFICIGLFGQHMPSIFSNRGFTLQQIIKHLFFTQEGVFGTPIGASSTFIFLFMLFGAFLEKTGVGQFFIDFGNAIAGSKRGGPAKVAVLSSALMGTISGSSVANTVGSGSFTIPMMKRLGYRPEFAAAVEASASTGGQIMPPVMGAAAFLMVDALGLSYATIAKAAIIPAILYFLGIWFAVDFEARKHGLKGLPKEELPKVKKLILEKGYLLLPLIAIIVTLSSGFTPSRAALIGIGTAIIGSYLRTAAELLYVALRRRTSEWVTRDPDSEMPNTVKEAAKQAIRNTSGMKPMDYVKALESGARSIIGVALACGVAGIVAGMITKTGIGAKLGTSLSALAGGNTYLLLFFTMIASIILGMGVPTTANYLITSTMMAGTVAAALNPGVKELTANMLLPAHMFTFYFGIVADITPPVALAAMAGSAIARSDPLKTGWQASKCAIGAFIVPYIFALNPAMLMIDATVWEIVQILITSVLGMFMIAMGVTGHWKVKLNAAERIIVFAGGLCSAIPGTLTDVIGIVILAGILALQCIRAKRSPAA